MTEWRECKLSDIADIQTGPFGSQLHQSDYVEIGTPIVTVEHLGNKRLKTQNLPMVSEQDKKRLLKYVLKTGDIVFSRVGSVDRCSYVSANENDWLFSGRCLRVRTNKDVFSEFLYYYFCMESTREHIRKIAVGATMPSINTSIMEELNVVLPPLSEQKAIEEVLSSLDDKIDLLTRQNKTLEDLAQAYFRKWFIEDASDEWEVGKLGDYIEIYDSKRVPLSNIEREKMKNGTLYPYYGAATIMDYVNDYLFDGEYILMGEDGTVETEDGYPVLQFATGKFWVNNHAHVLTAKSPFNNYFIWFFLKQCNISNIVTGAVQPKINQENLKNIDIQIPNLNLINSANHFFANIFTKILGNSGQIRTLSKLRDTLLPKLISGEIRVKM